MISVPGRERLEYGLAVSGVFGSLALMPPIGAFVAPMALAVYLARGRFRAGMGLLATAACAGFLAYGGAFAGAGSAVIACGLGIPIGIGIALWQSYGRVVALATLVFFAVDCAVLAGRWQEMDQFFKDENEKATAILEGPDPEEITLSGGEVWLGALQWLFGHWTHIFLGLAFTGQLIMACLLVSLTRWWIGRRDSDRPEMPGSFGTMRPPEWLVWFVIATAFLWFADWRWPSEALRVVSWNVALGLTGIYWLNGLSVLVYGLRAWKPHPLVVVAIVLALLLLNLVYLLSIAGLFDTWGNFRKKFDKMVAARNMHDHPHDEGEQ